MEAKTLGGAVPPPPPPPPPPRLDRVNTISEYTTYINHQFTEYVSYSLSTEVQEDLFYDSMDIISRATWAKTLNSYGKIMYFIMIDTCFTSTTVYFFL